MILSGNLRGTIWICIPPPEQNLHCSFCIRGVTICLLFNTFTITAWSYGDHHIIITCDPSDPSLPLVHSLFSRHIWCLAFNLFFFLFLFALWLSSQTHTHMLPESPLLLAMREPFSFHLSCLYLLYHKQSANTRSHIACCHCATLLWGSSFCRRKKRKEMNGREREEREKKKTGEEKMM